MNKKTKYIGFIGILIAAFLGVIDSTIVNIALPSITDYFKVSLNDTSWISTIYALALAVFMITASKLADQFGRKKLMIIGLLIFGVSSALCGFSNSLLFLIVMRFIQGIGGAIITPIVLPMGIEIFGKEKMQVVVGAAGAIVGFAAASGPPIGGILIKYVNWEAVFFVNVPLAIIALIIVLLFAEESYDNTVSKSIDWIGMIMITISLFSLTFALLKGRDYGWTSTTIIALLIAFTASLVIFIAAELKISNPMVELKLFKEFTFTASNICYMITGFAIMCPLLIFNYYLQNVLEYDTLKAAFIMISVSLTSMFATPMGSILSKKIGTRIVNFVGIFVMGIGILRLSYLRADTTIGIMVVNLIICGIGLGFSVQALSSSVKYIPKEKSGMGSGIINAARQIGSCIGIAILVSILNGNVSTAKDNIREDAISYINNRNELIKPVRAELIKIVNDKFKNSDNNTSDKKGMSQSAVEKSIKKVMMDNKNEFSKNAVFHNNNTLEKLYNGTSALRDGTNKVIAGEVGLNNGIKSLNSGLVTIYNGSNSLNSGLSQINNGVNQLKNGSQKLADGSQGITALINGIDTLNTGAQNFSNQFSPSNDKSNPTLYDRVTELNDGTQKVSNGVNSYVNTVDSTLYMMIKSNPEASRTLEEYKSELNIMKNNINNVADENSKNQYVQQAKMLSNMVSIYASATTSSNEGEFESKLKEDKNNIVYSGEALKAGTSSLKDGTSKFTAQFQDGGAVKNGVSNLTQGIYKLSTSSDKLVKLQEGIGSMNTAISNFSGGVNKIYDGSTKLKDGVLNAKNGSDKLVDGSNKLINSSYKIKDGTETVVTSIGMAGQKEEIQNVINKINDEKNDKLSEAFSKTFLIAAIVIMLTSILGLFTDKKVEDKEYEDKMIENI
ncbi:DHA2 family efflux MFS transporter permease subunit [Clostridium felsineum]|uniref:MDR family MFS transporter n=1 Tax=Clostridium felsineum TaxID=36839 RepID=UPI00214D798D|nr:MDR family MFS transporter [Clostridium felsineum]MCR3758861.1 DHA2 family efflux MFS transporter permease subunit [Clostridium felsineum]